MWYNKIMIGLLKSPLHGLLSKNMLLVNYTGRKSGETFSVPVNYLRDGNLLYTTSQKNRVWWRNLRDGKPVNLRLCGQEVQATPDVVEDPAGVQQLFARYFELRPNLARYFKVTVDERGKAADAELQTCAQGRVMILFKLR